MIRLTFITGAGIRRVLIEGRKITFIVQELNNSPLVIDLDKLEEEETKKKIDTMGIDKETIDILSSLKTEEAIAEDITIDFQRSGWRCTLRE